MARPIRARSLGKHHHRPSPAIHLLRAGILLGRESGSALVFALIFIFVVFATSLAISSRGLQGLIGSVFNQESKLARDAAEIGILRANMLLNEPKNRQLLVNADVIDSSTANAITSNKNLENPCPGSGTPSLLTSTSSMGIKSANGSDYPTIEIDDGTASGGIQRRFKIITIRQAGVPDLDSGATGGISITVRGEAYRDGKVLSTSTITREFEVLEKCCGLSLGGPSQAFGGDTRACDQGNPGLGLIAGTFFKSNGKFETTGGSGITFSDENGNALPTVYCLDESATNDCSDGGLNSGTDTQLKEVKPKLADVPPIPSSGSSSYTSCDGISEGTCAIDIDDTTILSTADFSNWGLASTVVGCPLASCETTTILPIVNTITTSSITQIDSVLRCNGNNDPVSGCRKNQSYVAGTITSTVYSTFTTTVGSTTSVITTGLTTSTQTANAELQNLKQHCFQNPDSGVTVTYCSLDRLEIANNKQLIVDTTGGPIRFYFPNQSTDSAPSIELENGQSAIVQVNSTKSPLSYADLIFYGMSRADATDECSSSSASCQHIQLGGGTADSTSFFAYFPAGHVELIGTATINGMVWSNIIEATGSTNFISSSSGVGEVITLLGMDNQDSGGDDSPVLLGEYVTRLTRRFSFF